MTIPDTVSSEWIILDDKKARRMAHLSRWRSPSRPGITPPARLTVLVQPGKPSGLLRPGATGFVGILLVLVNR